MLNKFVVRFLKFWHQLSTRERLLAQAVAALLVAFLLYISVQNAIGRIEELNSRIDNYQQDLVNYRQQIALRQRVEARYGRIAAQHSSAWSESELQDRLRQEIYRLAMKNPPGLTPDGYPERTSDDQENLVMVPGLQQGSLQEGGQGYREFMISFRVPRAEFSDLITFLERLQTSPQSLRIDDLELNRSPLNTQVQSTIQITRTIVDGTDTISTDVPITPVLTQWLDPLDITDWTCEGCDLEVGTDETNVLIAKNNGNGPAVLYTTYQLESARQYRVTMDALVSGSVSFAAEWNDMKQVSDNPIQLQNDYSLNRYEMQLLLPFVAEELIDVQIPLINLSSQDAEVAIHRLLIEETLE